MNQYSYIDFKFEQGNGQLCERLLCRTGPFLCSWEGRCGAADQVVSSSSVRAVTLTWTAWTAQKCFKIKRGYSCHLPSSC